MKIFHINMHNAWGGQPNRVLTKSVELRRIGHEVWVAGPRDCELVRRARAVGLPAFADLELRRGFHPLSMRRDICALRDLFRREKFDILHSHGSQDTWVTAFAARAFTPRLPLVRTRHNIFPIKGSLANRWLYRKCVDHVITVSPQVNVYLESQGLMKPDDITPIYSAPDPERFDPAIDPAGVREELGISPDDVVVVKVARLAPEKGHVHLVDAAAMLCPDFPTLKFLFAGTGRSRSDIEARIASHGLGDRIILAGFRGDVPRLLAASDIFVLSPTAGESLGTSILEGFLMNLPAVATDVGGVCESVRDGQTGFLVAPGDAQALAEALRNLIIDSGLRRRFGEAGRAMVLKEFTPRQLAEKTEAVYRKILAARAG
ncbi:glycosyltransferase family 4 protein [bacterium]|nr:glycosyltransferase family 4 protein [bacterium]